MAKKRKQPILVPVDFSPCSEQALLFAAELSACIAAPLTVAHVVHDPGEAPGYYHVKGRKKQLHRLEDVARQMLDEFVSRVVSEHSGLKPLETADKCLVAGLPVTRILELVEKLKPSSVVMGSEGRTGLSRALLGSKAEQVVRLCPVPVTIVKQRGQDRD